MTAQKRGQLLRNYLLKTKKSMTSIAELKTEIEEIKKRNSRVESDKAWEESLTRKLLILVLTYMVVAVFFTMVGLQDPLLGAVVPSLAFFLSTVTFPVIKRWWVRRIYNNRARPLK